jgi:SRSO17 transposase
VVDQAGSGRELIVRGKRISRSDIEVVCRFLREHGSSGRTEVAKQLCAYWGWYSKNGKPKLFTCLVVLTELAQRGLITAPWARKKYRLRRSKRDAPVAPEVFSTSEVNCDLAEQTPLRIESVESEEARNLWRYVLSRYHYLGVVEPVGASVRHLVYGRDGALLAALGWQSAVTHLASRDRIIGWDEEEKKEHLDRVATNVRFLIMPWVRIRNAASAILSRSIERLREDWWRKYKVELALLETFVDRSLFSGACYRAANWIAIGKSKGYAKKQGRHVYHGKGKEVYVYIVDANLRRKVMNDKAEPELNKEYLLSMYFEQRRSERRMNMSLVEERWEPKPEPEFDLEESDLKDSLVSELKKYHALYEDAFGRVEHLDLSRTYLMGLMSKTERKNVEAMALHMSGKDIVRNLQRFMTEHKWDDSVMRRIYWRESSTTLSEEDGVISIDASETEKKGKKSVGVAPQYCGNSGKTANCQSGVYVCYAGSKGHTLINSKLYMPECWFDEEHAERRKDCRVPKDLSFKTKPQIAIGLFNEVYATGLFKFKWVTVDASFGNNGAFLDSLPADILYLADIPCTRRLWLKESPGNPELEQQGCIAAALLEKPDLLKWDHFKVCEGGKGPVVSDFARVRVYVAKERTSENERWLLLCNRADGEIKYSLSNAPAEISFEDLVRVSRYRWPVERSFQEGKGELGMDHYEQRSWPAWHRHMLFVCLAQLFLTRTRLALKKSISTDSAAMLSLDPGCTAGASV